LTHGSWEDFVDKYDRVQSTVEKLYRVELLKEEKEQDLEKFKRLKEILKRYNLVQDTVLLINQEIKAGKRILVEDCSSSSLDIDTGIYPYTSSFHTTTGAVCTGLGVPEEVIETTIGVMSAMTIIDRAFLAHIKNFPSQVLETESCH
jgi:adenylosuccinate synthase